MLTAGPGEISFTGTLISPSVVHCVACPGNLRAALYGYLGLFLPVGQSQCRWEMTWKYDFSIYGVGATRNMLCYYAVETVLCQLSPHSADLVSESFDLMAVSVPDTAVAPLTRAILFSFPVPLIVMSTPQRSLFGSAFTITIALCVVVRILIVNTLRVPCSLCYMDRYCVEAGFEQYVSQQRLDGVTQ